MQDKPILYQLLIPFEPVCNDTFSLHCISIYQEGKITVFFLNASGIVGWNL